MWHFDPSSCLATTDMDGKVQGGCCAPFWAAGSQSNTMWLGVLIHPTIWPQYTNVTDRQTNRMISQDRQQSGSIVQTVLRTVTQ